MALIDDFADKRQNKFEKDIFAPLHKQGLYNFATSAYNRFTESIELKPSRIQQNMYLLLFMSCMKDIEELEETLAQPDAAEHMVDNLYLQQTKALRIYGKEYFEQSGKDSDVSDDLYAASMIMPLLDEKINAQTFKGLANSDVFSLASQANYLVDHPHKFKKSDLSQEVKLLHLTQVIKGIDIVIESSNYEKENKKTLSQATECKMQDIVDHIEDLYINAKDKPHIEEVIKARQQTFKNILENPSLTNSNSDMNLLHPALF